MAAGLLFFSRGRVLFWALGLPARLKDLVRLQELLSGEREEALRFAGELAALESENAFLRDALEIPRVASSSRVLVGRVLTTRPQFLSHTLVIDQGRLAAVEPGMVVFLSSRRYVGRVEEVFERTSLVRTVFHPASAVVARTAEANVKGLVQGRFASGIVFWGLVERGLPAAGQEVVSAGEGFGGGFGLGRIQTVRRDAGEATFRADLVPAFEGVPEFVLLLRP